MAEYQIKDGISITLDSAKLNILLNYCDDAREMRLALREMIGDCAAQDCMKKEDAEEPCRYKYTCIGACDWCKSHDYSEACVPMLQERLRHITKELDFIGAILQTIKEN